MGKKKERRREAAESAKEQKQAKIKALAQEVADLKVRVARVESSNHTVPSA